MSTDLESLRAEMLKWQDRRFDLLKHSTGVVTALLGFKLVAENSGATALSTSTWPLVSALLLLYLSASNTLTWYAGVANSKLAAYIKVFHEVSSTGEASPRWETRLSLLKRSGLDPQNLNRWITLVYLILGLVSVVLPFASAGFAYPDNVWLTVLLVCIVPFAITLTMVALYSYPREQFELDWKKLQQQERQDA
jgi:hypothetical protein